MPGPYLPNLQPILAAGINPRTGLPNKISGANNEDLASQLRIEMRVLDEQDAVRRYQWFNLPPELSEDLVERILYYKGQGMFFYMEADMKFYFLPYTLYATKEDMGIDVYGRYTSVTPLPFNGATKTEKAWITGLSRKVVYNVDDFVDEPELIFKGCVVLKDYCEQISQTVLPRQQIQDPLLNAMSEALPMARTSLLANSGIKAIRVTDADAQSNVKQASMSVERAALTGDPFIPITSAIEMQELTSQGSALKSEEYLLYLQALDNLRLSYYGLGEGGLFQKKAHMLESEQNANAGVAKFAYTDGLKLRQQFCDRVNSIWGLGIWCDTSEDAMEVDKNGDGEASDDSQPQNPGIDNGGADNESNGLE